MGHSKGSPERKIYSHECIYKRRERSEINDIMLHLKLLEKEEQVNLKRRREIIKLSTEINEIETKNTIQRINEKKSWFFEKISKIDRPCQI
jgi:hypothetical protein